MSKPRIKNVVFDIGNVVVRWDPFVVVEKAFPASENIEVLTEELFRSASWRALNAGRITEPELIQIYQREFDIDGELLKSLMAAIKESLQPIPGSMELLQQLDHAGVPLYALTDNTHEIVSYLKSKYQFWQYFKGAVVSAEIGYLKPSPEIYQYLLDQYLLDPRETVFIDDHLPNVEGARLQNIFAIQFKNTAQCIDDLRQLLHW